MKYFYVYKITNNVNGKIYIGKRTSKVRPDKDINYFGSGKLINRAISKYGKENFSKEILAECSKQELCDLEIQYIKLFGSQDPSIGYNILDGGEGTGTICSNLKTYYSEKEDREIRISSTEEVPEGFHPGRRKFTDKAIEKMKRVGPNNGMFGVHRFGKLNPFYGKKHSNETKERLSEIAKSKKYVINPDTKDYKILKAGDAIPNGYITTKEYQALKKEAKKTKEELTKCWSEKRKNYWNKKGMETCPFCGKTGRGVGFSRWHGDNCNQHPIYGPENQEKHRQQAITTGKKELGHPGTTTNKVCITNGIVNKFVPPEDICKYEGFSKGMTKRKPAK